MFEEGSPVYYQALWENSAIEWKQNVGRPVHLSIIEENPFKISEFHSPWPVYTCTFGLDRDEKHDGKRVDARSQYMYHWQFPIGKISGRFQPLRITVNMGDYCGPLCNALKRLTDDGTWEPLTLNIAAKRSMSLRDTILEGDVLWYWLVTPYLPEVLSQYEYHRSEEILRQTRGVSRGQWYFDVKLMDGSIMTIDDQQTLSIATYRAIASSSWTCQFLAWESFRVRVVGSWSVLAVIRSNLRFAVLQLLD